MHFFGRIHAEQAEGWGVGPLMAQVAHATSAVGSVRFWLDPTQSTMPMTLTIPPICAQVLHETRDRPETQAYLGDLKNMRKVRLNSPTQ